MVSAEEEVPVAVVGVEVGIDRPAQLGLLAVPRHPGHRPRLVIQELLDTYIQLKYILKVKTFFLVHIQGVMISD